MDPASEIQGVYRHPRGTAKTKLPYLLYVVHALRGGQRVELKVKYSKSVRLLMRSLHLHFRYRYLCD